MRKFEFNDSGCCTNPEVIVSIGIDNRHNLCIEVAFDGKYWRVGTGYTFTNSGGGCGACKSSYRSKYKTKEEAVQAGIDYIKDRIENKKEDCNFYTKDKQLVTIFNAWLANRNQLTLFPE